jgi:hypothetical protein
VSCYVLEDGQEGELMMEGGAWQSHLHDSEGTASIVCEASPTAQLRHQRGGRRL